MTGEDHDLARILEIPAPPEGCPTHWTLERYALDELVGDEREGVAIHVAACTLCREEVAHVDGYREDFLKQHPFGSVEAEVAERAMFLPDEPEIEVAAPTWTKVRLIAIAMAAGAVTLVVSMVFVPVVSPSSDPIDGLKGATDLQAARLRDGDVQPVEPETTVRPGDEIQFRVDTGRYDHVIVLGMDGTGKIAVYQPLGGGHSVVVEPGAGRTLDPAFRLDDAPGPEVYVAIFTDEAVASKDAEDLLRAWADAGGATSLAVGAPETALGGAVEVLFLDKEVD